jgi:hypothetical protein
MDDSGLAPQRDHPSLAVVLIARRGGDALARSVQSLTAAARSLGIEVLLLLATAESERAAIGRFGGAIREVVVDPGDPESVWRARALAHTAADVVEFVGDEAAGAIDWLDRLPFRMGILRRDLESQADLRAVLARQGVSTPPSAGRP